MSASEAEGRRLYGPPPEGDEDPHANQYPSDPAGTTGPPRITAGQLNSSHLGHTIRVEEKLAGGYSYVAQGMLTLVSHGASLVAARVLGSGEESYEIGRKWVQVDLGMFRGARVSVDATVELLD